MPSIPSKRRPAAAPTPAPKRQNPFDEKPMSQKDIEYFREQKRQEDQRKNAAEQYDKFGDPFKKAKGGKVMAKPGSKMPPMFAKKAPAKAPAKAGMKRMMGGGSCK